MGCWATRIAEARNQKTATGGILFVCAGMLPPVVMEMLWNIASGGRSGQFALDKLAVTAVELQGGTRTHVQASFSGSTFAVFGGIALLSPTAGWPQANLAGASP